MTGTSKTDAMRAMREARFEEAAVARAEESTEAPAVRLCGHRAISGRTCTREHGHAAKSHRYS